MRVGDILKLSTRMFRTRPQRTWLTILGIGVGIGAVVLLVGLGYGLQGILLERIIFGESLLSLNVSNPPSRAILLDEKSVNEFLKIPHVEDIAPLTSFSALMRLNDIAGNIKLEAVDPQYFRYAGIPIKQGESFKESDNDKIIVSYTTLKLFGVSSTQAIGKRVKFKVFIPQKNSNEIKEVEMEKEYEIVGIVESPSLLAYMLLPEFKAHFVVPYYERVEVKVDDSKNLDVVQKSIIGKGFVVSALSKTVEQANKIFRGVQVTLGLFGGIALIVSAIGMFNTMTVTLLERTNEIGIMRTIGASSKDIMILFLSESIILGFLGGAVGVGIGLLIGKILNMLLTAVATKLGGVAVTLFVFPYWFLGFTILFAGFMGLITGIFPARKASILNPLDAIRYK